MNRIIVYTMKSKLVWKIQTRKKKGLKQTIVEKTNVVCVVKNILTCWKEDHYVFKTSYAKAKKQQEHFSRKKKFATLHEHCWRWRGNMHSQNKVWKEDEEKWKDGEAQERM